MNVVRYGWVLCWNYESMTISVISRWDVTPLGGDFRKEKHQIDLEIGSIYLIIKSCMVWHKNNMTNDPFFHNCLDISKQMNFETFWRFFTSFDGFWNSTIAVLNLRGSRKIVKKVFNAYSLHLVLRLGTGDFLRGWWVNICSQLLQIWAERPPFENKLSLKNEGLCHLCFMLLH